MFKKYIVLGALLLISTPIHAETKGGDAIINFLENESYPTVINVTVGKKVKLDDYPVQGFTTKYDKKSKVIFFNYNLKKKIKKNKNINFEIYNYKEVQGTYYVKGEIVNK